MSSPNKVKTIPLKQICINIFFSFSASGHRPADSSAHSSSGSFHSSRGPLGVHNSWTDKPTNRGVNSHHNLHHNLPSNSETLRENIPEVQFQPPHGRELKLPAVKPSADKEKKTLRDIVPPLCAARLKPIRQKTKNAVVRPCSFLKNIYNYLLILTLKMLMSNYFLLDFLQVSILDTGEVCMELLKCQSGQERVKEVLRISCDGLMVSCMYCT